ncbi:hypothetical protein ACP4OV_010413 [Aristida adscensionis]
MAMASPPACMVACFLLLTLVAPALSRKSPDAGPLSYDFYGRSCPKAEEVIRNVTEEIISEDSTMRGTFLKLFFYDCFQTGCDASILLNQTDSNPSSEQEKQYRQTLGGFDALNKVKAALEAICPGIVSCADIIALTARDSVMISGGFTFAMPTGRRDGLISSQWSTTELPSPLDHLPELIKKLTAKGLDIDNLVALSGAHSFGRSHCSSFPDHLYGFADPTFNATYVNDLRMACDQDFWNTVVNNSPVNPNHLSNRYYSNVQSGNTLFTSDQALLNRSDTAAKVAFYAANQMFWMAAFGASLVKMGSIQVLTGSAGEIRKLCNVTNSGN